MRDFGVFLAACVVVFLISCGGSGVDRPQDTNRPTVNNTNPADGATSVFLDQGISADAVYPNGGLDINTLTTESVRLIDRATGVQVEASVGTSGGFDSITLQPKFLLARNTEYSFEVTEDLKDISGASFEPHSSSFTTGTAVQAQPLPGVAFTKHVAWSGNGTRYTALAIGPDGKLYAGTVSGDIQRFIIDPADGSLSLDTTNSVLSGRLLIGLEFDPAATSDNLVAWVTHTELRIENGVPTGDDWTGKLTRLSGPNLSLVEDIVVGLPRSTIDHVTNGIDFGPDGALYLAQGSNSGMGAPDAVWGWRPERLLTAAILRVDPNMIDSPPLNVRTEGLGDQNYDPFAPDAPVTIFASGIRNAYDLKWHSRDELFVPGNASAANNNVPRTPATLPARCSQRLDGSSYNGPIINNGLTGPNVYSISSDYVSEPGNPSVGGYPNSDVQPDWLFSVVESGYYGHPNPTRCEWVMDGGNDGVWPESAVGPYETGTPADPNYRGFVYAFPVKNSPNGIIEYQSNTFGGLLAGKLLIARFSLQDDIVIVTPGANPGDPVDVASGNEGLTGFSDPLTLVEDPATGNIYVSEFVRSGSGLSVPLDRNDGSWIGALQSSDVPQITLLKPN